MNNVFAFHGVDHKVGTTQIAQCVAELLSKKYPDSSVLLIQGDGGRGSEYCNHVNESIERIRPFLAQSVINTEEIKLKSLYKDNLYIIGGQDKPEFSEYLTPDMAEILIAAVKEVFDFVIIDTGSQIEDSFALGAVLSTDRLYFIINQRESTLRNYEFYSYLYERIDVVPDLIIINCFNKRSLYEKDYIEERLMIDESKILTIRESKQGAKAEINGKSIVSLKPEKAFINDLEEIIKDIVEHARIGI